MEVYGWNKRSMNAERMTYSYILDDHEKYMLPYRLDSAIIHQFYDLTSTRLRLQSFGICLDDESQVRTLIRRNLTDTQLQETPDYWTFSCPKK